MPKTSSKSFGCPWDSIPVQYEGATCDLTCYRSWIWWMQTQAETPRLLKLQNLEVVPLDLEQQPWYADTVGIERIDDDDSFFTIIQPFD